MKILLATLLSAVTLSGTAIAREEFQRIGAPATVSYAHLDGLFSEFITDMKGDGVYLRDQHRNWYFARFASRCTALLNSRQLAFRESADKTIAQGTVVVVPTMRGNTECRIADFSYSGAPDDTLRNRLRTGNNWLSMPPVYSSSVVGERPSPGTSLH